jgi:hypothetical protein
MCPSPVKDGAKSGRLKRLIAIKRHAPVADRLFRYDRRIAINATRAIFPQWRDRLLAVTALLIAVAAVRAWFADRPWWVASWQACGASAVCGIACGHLIQARLAFHAADGPLAADALRPRTRLRYAAMWHVTGIATLAAVTVVARAPLLVVSLPGYAAGMVAAHGASGLAAKRWPFMKDGARRWIRLWLRHPLAAGVAAIALLVSLALLSSSLTQGALAVIAGVETALLVLALTTIDDGLVRFMAIAGHGSWGTIMRQGRGTALFLGWAVPVCLLVFGQTLAAIVAAIGATGLLLMAMRTLAYRLHRKRSADFLVMVMTTILALAAFAMPIMFPLIAVAILWQLQRRANARTWMLA